MSWHKHTCLATGCLQVCHWHCHWVLILATSNKGEWTANPRRHTQLLWHKESHVTKQKVPRIDWGVGEPTPSNPPWTTTPVSTDFVPNLFHWSTGCVNAEIWEQISESGTPRNQTRVHGAKDKANLAHQVSVEIRATWQRLAPPKFCYKYLGHPRSLGWLNLSTSKCEHRSENMWQHWGGSNPGLRAQEC
jgi:hypothetical protein